VNRMVWGKPDWKGVLYWVLPGSALGFFFSRMIAWLSRSPWKHGNPESIAHDQEAVGEFSKEEFERVLRDLRRGYVSPACHVPCWTRSDWVGLGTQSLRNSEL
jgi:hypothetical protein